MPRLRRQLVIGILLLVVAGCHRGKNQGAPIEVTVAAAVSLRGVLPELIEAFGTEHARPHVVAVYGGSGDLRKRVEDGAPFDVVLFAAGAPVDRLIEARHVAKETRTVIAHNRLVLIGPTGGRRIDWQSLDQLADDEKLAIGEPEAVPAGAYAKSALQALGKWDKVQGKLVFGADVGAVLSYVRRGEVVAAVVYTTEVVGVKDVVVLEEAKGTWAPRPEVVGGTVKAGAHAGPGARFLEFLVSPKARGLLQARGFDVDG